MPATKIDFKASSWDKAKGDVKGDKLASALKAVEKALADEKKKKNNPDAIQAAADAIMAASQAASQTIKKECDAKKHKDLVAGLKKFDADCKAEIKRLEDAKAKAGDGENDDEGDVSDDQLTSLKHLRICLTKAKTKRNALDGVSFVFGVAKKPEDCVLVMHKKKAFSQQLWRRFEKVCRADEKMKKAGLKRSKLTHGAAFRSADDSTTLVLQIDVAAKTDIPAMDVRAEKWMLRNKTDLAPFKKLLIVGPTGKPIKSPPETAEDGDEAAPQEVGPGEGQPETQEVRPGEGQGETQEVRPGDAQPETQEVRPGEGQGETQGAENEVKEQQFEDLRKQFKKARRSWQTVKERAIQDLEAVKDGIRDYYLDDPEQYKIATSKLGELDAIMDNLNDDLRDVLDQYVSTPKNRQAELERLGDEATTIVNRFLDYASKDRLLGAVDQKEFADVEVKAPIEKALKDLVKTLA